MSAPKLYEAHLIKMNPYRGFTIGGSTGTIAATADGVLWTFRNPEAGPQRPGSPLAIQRILSWTVNVVAFTTAITAGRGLELVRGVPTTGTAANPSGGTAFTGVLRDTAGSEQLGVGQIATTGVLTVTGYTFSAPLRIHDTSAQGAAGAGQLRPWEFDLASDPLILRPGELLALRTRQAMDAAGTFRLNFELDGTEMPRL